ncbi:MAG: hypothetical protein NUV31_01340 [Dehalococcoidales bacterium]|nr:hypothetical protein [Dehalococcoidales bacterium]
MNALILAPFESHSLDLLSSRIGVIYRSWTESRQLIEPEELIDYIQNRNAGIVVIEADFIFEEVIESADRLRLIGVCRGSVNNVDIEAATRHGIPVINTPGRNNIAVAELTVGLTLSLVRHIPEAHSLVKSGGWIDPVGPYISLRGTELFGKTIGIIGFGAIGREVTSRMLALGMKVLVYDPYVDGSEIEGRGAKPVSLDELLKEADFISVHCSITDETRGMLNAQRLASLKQGVYFINTAGWEIAEESALLEALKDGRIAGAAFDIFDTHPLSPRSPLLKLPNVILTPHIGGATDNTIARYSQMITRDILRFLDGLKPVNLINPEVWRTDERQIIAGD